MAKPLQKPAASTSYDVCNAESDLVSKSSVLEIIARQRAAFEFLNVAGGLSPESPCRFTRERFEIVAGKLLCCDSIAGLIRQLPPKPSPDLMGEKPISSAVPLDAVLAVVERRKDDAHRECLFHASNSGIVPASWSRADAREQELAALAAELAEKFPGNAEEQPGPREESRPSIGAIPCDGGRGESPARFGEADADDDLDEWLELRTSAELASVAERILDELDCRGSAARWSPVS